VNFNTAFTIYCKFHAWVWFKGCNYDVGVVFIIHLLSFMFVLFLFYILNREDFRRIIAITFFFILYTHFVLVRATHLARGNRVFQLHGGSTRMITFSFFYS